MKQTKKTTTIKTKTTEIKNYNQKKEELELAQALGLTAQVEMIKLDMKGYNTIRVADFSRLLQIDNDAEFSIKTLKQFRGRLPFGVLCKLQELRKNRIFDRVFVVAPDIAKTPDPLLVGEKFLLPDNEVCGDFFARERLGESIIVLIAKWE